MALADRIARFCETERVAAETIAAKRKERSEKARRLREARLKAESAEASENAD
jgi:hypothetical protein